VSTGKELPTFRIITAFIFKVKRFKSVLGLLDLGYEGAYKTSENTFLTTRCNVQNGLVLKMFDCYITRQVAWRKHVKPSNFPELIFSCRTKVTVITSN